MKTKKWQKDLTNLIASCWDIHENSDKLYCKFEKNDSLVWECDFAPAMQEFYGGPNDGKKNWSGFDFWVNKLLEDTRINLQSISFYAPSKSFKEESSTLILGGVFMKKHILIMIHSVPPLKLKPIEKLT